jgi:hypothetical protein
MLLQPTMATLAGFQVALWALLRRTALTRPVLPTDLPFWFDRVVTAAALAGGVALIVVSLMAMFREPPKAARSA